MQRIRDLPLLLILAGAAALAMLLPAMHGFVQRDYAVARAFFYASLLSLLLIVLIAIAVSTWQPRNLARSHLAALVLAYVVLPPLLAVPLHQALPGTSYHDAWFEMVSAFTTTGATTYAPERLSDTLHLWRALVGWLGGYFVLLSAVSILAPLNLGGFEVVSGGTVGHGIGGGRQGDRTAPPAERVLRTALTLFPVYGGLTLLLWLLLLLAGDPSLVALCHAMGTLSTSGISPLPLTDVTGSGLGGEALILIFFAFALTRRAYVGASFAGTSVPLRRDPEVRIALACIMVLPLVQFLQHWTGLYVPAERSGALDGLLAFWGGIFTTLSFLTTTGYISEYWQLSRDWAGPGSSGLILLGLALIGGGVATTAGGVKLLRVYALFRHGERELQRLIHPSSVGGDGMMARRLRREGAHVAFIFFVLFAVSIMLVMAALTLAGQEFEPAMVLAVATLSTTGPLAVVAGEHPLPYAVLSPLVKDILAAAMILGRLEMLALLVLLAPDSWRR
jgi:trk system potassium uptake protein TrkH